MRVQLEELKARLAQLEQEKQQMEQHSVSRCMAMFWNATLTGTLLRRQHPSAGAGRPSSNIRHAVIELLPRPELSLPLRLQESLALLLLCVSSMLFLSPCLLFLFFDVAAAAAAPLY